MQKSFIKQVELLLRIAPEIVKIEEFALHGGTAINLFYHNMPRLSVDIDLTYIPIKNEMQLVPEGQLFGGKIVAALDRQHPRDLFDTMQMLNNTGLTDQIMIGFLFCLFSSKRPFDELLNPNLLSQANIIENHFKGMTKVPFNNNIFESERTRLIQAINNKLSVNQKEMIMSIAKGEPSWLYEDWSMYPGIAWKQKNIGILKKRNFEKFKTQINNLENILA